MQDNDSNQDEKVVNEEPFQMEEGLSLNVLNNMMEETLIRDSQNSFSPQDEPSNTAFKIAGIQEEKIKTFGHKFITAMNKVRASLFSEAETLKFMNSELLQYEDYQKIFDQPSCFSYLSLPELGTVWILQIDSELALSLASIFRARRIEDQTQVKLSNHLDGALFFEIGPYIQRIFDSIYMQIFNSSLSPKIQLRHMLSPAFHREIKKEKNLLVFHFVEESQNLKGKMRLALPADFIRRLH